MSQRALALPLRTQILRPQWICRRCLATESEAPPTPPINIEPPVAPTSDSLAALDLHKPRWTPKDPILARRLPHRIPDQYYQHSTSDDLNRAEQRDREQTTKHQDIRGVVVSAGLMDKTVRVRVPGRRWNRRIGKYFASYTQHLCHDPNNSLIVGDVIQMHRLHVSSQVFHVVGAITAPFGKPLSERPPVPTPDERLSKYKEKRFAKLDRRKLRRKAAMGDAEAIKELQAMGLDPGKGVEAGKGQSENVQKDIGKKRNPTNKDGGILGNKGQKLPAGVLPGGKHEVGKIDQRAKHNKESAMKLKQQTEANILEAKEKEDALNEQGLRSDAKMPRKSSVGEPAEQETGQR